MSSRTTVAIIGGGPSGLTAAAALADAVDGEVRVFEREVEAGGIPRHSDHLGYGIRDLRRFISGPVYAKRLVTAARSAGAVVETEAMVTDWIDDHTFHVTSPKGRRVVEADAIVLATGARERPRSARRIPGGRPDGVFTTGQLQNLVHLHHRAVGKKAVIVGGELVSWSAALTLKEAGCKPVLMSTQYRKSESYTAFRLLGKPLFGLEIAPRTRLVRINGKTRVESVEIENMDTGQRRTVECDTVITTGDWIPDNELARSAGIDIDDATLGPQVDADLATSTPGMFAIGNLVHPVDTADVAALDGRHILDPVRQWLSGGIGRVEGPQIVADAPLRWVAPQIYRPGVVPSRGKLSFWADDFVSFPEVMARQDGQLIGSCRVPWPCAPGRVFRVPFALLDSAATCGGPIHISLGRSESLAQKLS